MQAELLAVALEGVAAVQHLGVACGLCFREHHDVLGKGPGVARCCYQVFGLLHSAQPAVDLRSQEALHTCPQLVRYIDYDQTGPSPFARR